MSGTRLVLYRANMHFVYVSLWRRCHLRCQHQAQEYTSFFCSSGGGRRRTVGNRDYPPFRSYIPILELRSTCTHVNRKLEIEIADRVEARKPRYPWGSGHARPVDGFLPRPPSMYLGSPHVRPRPKIYIGNLILAHLDISGHVDVTAKQRGAPNAICRHGRPRRARLLQFLRITAPKGVETGSRFARRQKFPYGRLRHPVKVAAIGRRK